MPELDVADSGYTLTAPAGKHITFTVSGNGAIKLNGPLSHDGVIKLKAADGSDAANALLMGIGTSADPALTAVADKVFVELRTKSSATSGDSRLLYMRHDIGGAGGSGEALRVLTDLTAAAVTARGAQISLQVGSTGYISGLGVGVDAQLYLKNSVLPANGTYGALNAEIYSEGTTTAVSAVTELAFIRLVNGGNATGIGRVDDKVYLLSIRGGAVGAGNMVVASATEANYSHAARCYLEGVGDVWLMFASASG